MVSGPGQKRAASVRAASGTSVQHFSKASGPGTMSERGFTLRAALDLVYALHGGLVKAAARQAVDRPPSARRRAPRRISSAASLMFSLITSVFIAPSPALQALRTVGGDERVYELVQRAVHYLVYLVQRQADAVVRHAAWGKL